MFRFRFCLVVLFMLSAALSMNAYGFTATFFWYEDGDPDPDVPLADSCQNGTPLPAGTTVYFVWDQNDNGIDAFDPLAPLLPAEGTPPPWYVDRNSFELTSPGYYLDGQTIESFGAVPEPADFYLVVCRDNLSWRTTMLTITSGDYFFYPADYRYVCNAAPCSDCFPPPELAEVEATDWTRCDGILVTWLPYGAEPDHRFSVFRNSAWIWTSDTDTARSYLDPDAPVQVTVIYHVAALRICPDTDTTSSPSVGTTGRRQPWPPIADTVSASDDQINQVTVTFSYSSAAGLSYWTVRRDLDSVGTVANVGLPGERTFVHLNPPPGPSVYDVVGYGSVCGYGQSLHSDTGEAIIVAADPAPSPLITEYALHPAFPNPFNAETQLRFDVPHSAHAFIRVHDVTGREVARLADQDFAPGSHTIAFSAARFSTGLYFVTLTADHFSQTQKLLLLK